MQKYVFFLTASKVPATEAGYASAAEAVDISLKALGFGTSQSLPRVGV